MMSPAFTISYMDRYLPLMHRIIADRTADWIARGEVDLLEETRKITFDVAAEALIGLRAGPEVDRFREIFFGMLTLGEGVVGPFDYDGELRKLQAELYAMLLPKIRERRERPTDDVLGMLTRARDDAGRALSDEQLIAHCNILLVAGHETSTSLSAWLLYLLVTNPAYLARVLAEQDALLAPGAEPGLDAVKQMSLLDNALSEAERLYPPVPAGPRGVVEDFTFGGYHIPADTMLLYSIAGSHHISSIFAHPERFDPDRFAQPRQEDRKNPYALVGFGGGPRICMGINLAQVEIKAMASHILRRMELSVVPGQYIAQVYGATGMPAMGIRMAVRARGSST
jgi:cytochrome P450